MKKTVDSEKFVTLWQSNMTVKQIAEEMGMRLNTAYVYANWMRRVGVPLRMKGNSTRKKDYVRLAQLARESKK